MTPERVQELLQILWNTVQNADDLQQFVQTYGRELDQDFFAGIAAVIESTKDDEDDSIARFFAKMGQLLISLLRPSSEEEEEETEERIKPEEAVRRSLVLIHILFEEVNSDKDLFHFAAEHLHECDDTFFAVLQHVTEQEKTEGNEGNARFFEQVSRALQELRQHAEAPFRET